MAAKTRIAISHTSVCEGDLFYDRDQDGQLFTRRNFFVRSFGCGCDDGVVFLYERIFEHRNDAETFAARVSFSIDPDLWAEDMRLRYSSAEWEDDAAAMEAAQRDNNDEPFG